MSRDARKGFGGAIWENIDLGDMVEKWEVSRLISSALCSAPRTSVAAGPKGSDSTGAHSLRSSRRNFGRDFAFTLFELSTLRKVLDLEDRAEVSDRSDLLSGADLGVSGTFAISIAKPRPKGQLETQTYEGG